jgi:hypothetical protein
VRVTLTVTLPDETFVLDEEIALMASATADVDADGVEEQDIPTVLLLGIDRLLAGRHTGRLREQYPMANLDMLDAMAVMNARLELLSRANGLPFAAS